MTRVVLDTNVLAFGSASGASTPKSLIDRWQKGEFVLVVSEHLLAELARTFGDAYYRVRVSTQQSERSFAHLRTDGMMVE